MDTMDGMHVSRWSNFGDAYKEKDLHFTIKVSTIVHNSGSVKWVVLGSIIGLINDIIHTAWIGRVNDSSFRGLPPYFRDQCRFGNDPLPKRSHQIQQNCFCANTPSPPLGVPTPEPCGHGYENSWGEWSEWDVCKIIDERRCNGRRLRTRKCCGTCDRGSSRDSGDCKGELYKGSH